MAKQVFHFIGKGVNGEIILQIPCRYIKKLDIGSAKIRPEEMQGVKHYLVDVLEPEEEFHIVKFQQMAKEAMEEIYEKERYRFWSEEPDFIFRR